MRVLDGLLDLLLGKPTLKSATEAAARALRAHGETDLEVDTTEGLVITLRDGKPGATLSVHNLLHELLQTPRSGRAAVVRRFVGGIASADVSTPKTFEEAAPTLRPVVRFAHEFSIHALITQMQLGSESLRVERRPVVNDVVAALALDLPDSMSIVTEQTLKDWGVSFEDAFEHAILNLRGQTPPEGWKSVQPGVWSGEWDDSYESSRLLLPDVIHKLGVRDPVAMVPFRGTIIVTSAHDERGLARMLDVVEGALETSNRWISFMPALLQERTWVPFTPPPSLQERFRRLNIHNVSSSYGQQKDLLEKKYEKEGVDVYVATYSVLEREGQALSWASWAKGVSHALLPVTDLVIFGAPDEADLPTLVVPWDRVREVVGHLMLGTEIDPPRFRVHDFPSPEEFTRLQAVAATVMPKQAA